MSLDYDVNDGSDFASLEKLREEEVGSFPLPVRIHLLAFSLDRTALTACGPHKSVEDAYWYVREEFFVRRHQYENWNAFFTEEDKARSNRYKRKGTMKEHIEKLKRVLGDEVADYIPPWILLEAILDT